MNKHELTALAERVEAAEGPTWALFNEAFVACFPEPAPDCEPSWRPENPKQPIYHAWKTRQITFEKFLCVEAWLDAALTLVPEEMRDEIEISTLYRVARVGINLNHAPDSGPFYGSNACNSIPLALCAAALKARAPVAAALRSQAVGEG